MDRHANVNSAALRTAREAAGLSREGLAAKAGVSLKTIERLEAGNGDHEPRRATLAVIALALGIAVDALTAEPLTGEAA